MQLSHGKVTQNGSKISYKTYLQGEAMSTYQELVVELKNALDIEGIAHDDDFCATHAAGVMRKNCITVYVTSFDIAAKQLPYSSHCID